VTGIAPRTIAVSNALDAVLRRSQAKLLASLSTRLGDLAFAEDVLQEASVSALAHWGRSGIPASPEAWLMRAAINKSIDRFRARAREGYKTDAFAQLREDQDIFDEAAEIPDERLRLIFACCHPALEEKSRIALTLRVVCGLTTREIAAVFLDPEAAVGQRISRTKQKIKAKGITFDVPDRQAWPDRLPAVLSSIYLIFTAGYVNEDCSTRDLCLEALFLMRLVQELHPADAEIEGALALMLFTHARRKARINKAGASVPIGEQDRKLWQIAEIEEGERLLTGALEANTPGPFQLKAAIAAAQMQEGGADWKQIALLYHQLWQHEPTPVIMLNWCVAVAECGRVEEALQRLEMLHEPLAAFQPFHAARAEFLARLNRRQEARCAYEAALRSAPHEASRRFLEQRMAQLEPL